MNTVTLVWIFFISVTLPVFVYALGLGCYSEDIANRTLQLSTGEYSPLGPVKACVYACYKDGQRYAGLHQGHCLCGTDLPNVATDVTQCDAKCPETSVLCGGNTSQHITVFDTSYVIKEPSINVKQGVVELFKGTEVNVTTQSSGYHESILEFSDELVPVKANSTIHFFRKTGEVVIESSSTDMYENSASASTTVDVLSRVLPVTLICPEFVTVKKEFECLVTVTASSANVTMSLANTDTVVLQSINTSVYINGPTSANKLLSTTNITTNQNGLTFLYNRPITFNGTLQGWEVNVKKVGRITIQIYRPGCSHNSTHKFCPRSRTCIPKAGNCSSTTNANVWYCNGTDEIFSLRLRKCVNKSTGTVIERKTQPSLENDIKWLYVGEFGRDFSLTGIQYVNLNENDRMSVREGDVPAIYKTTGEVQVASSVVNVEFQIGTTSAFTNRASYPYAFSNTDVTGSGKHDSLLNLYISRFMYVTAPVGVLERNASDIENVTVTVSNSINSESASTSVKVQKPISGLQLNGSYIVPSFTRVQQAAAVSYGNNVSFTWSPGDVNSTEETVESEDLTAKAEFVYTAAGVYEWRYRAWNMISSEEASQNITVEDLLFNVSVSPTTFPATVRGQLTMIRIEKSQGEPADFIVDFGDSTVVKVTSDNFTISGDPEEMAFRRRTNMTLLSSPMETITGATFRVCLRKCLLHPEDNFKCKSFEYNRTSNNCYLRNTTINCNNSCIELRRTWDSDVYELKEELFSVDITKNLSPDKYSSSSHLSTDYTPGNAKLDSSRAWKPLGSDLDPFVQIELERASLIIGITVQGDGSSNWVTSFTAESRNVGEPWHHVDNGMDFQANVDSSTSKQIMLGQAILCRYLRIRPKGYQGEIAVRIGLKGATATTSIYDFQYKYAENGIYQVTVAANNSLSSASDSSKVTVQTAYSGLRITSPAIRFGESTQLLLTSVTGSGPATITASFAATEVGTTNCKSALPCNVTLDAAAHVKYGDFPFTFSVANLVSDPITTTEVVSVDHILADVELHPTQTAEATGTPAIFALKFKSHVSRLNITADFRDNTTPDIIYVEYYDNQTVIFINHTFLNAGVYAPKFYFKSLVTDFTKITTITIQNAVANISFTDNGPQPILNNDSYGNVHFQFHFSGSSLRFPTNATALIDYGDTFTDLILLCSNLTNVSHNYTKYGTYSVKVNISNIVSFAYFDTEVVVEEKIQGLSHQVARDYIQIGDTVELTASVVWGSNVNFTWSFNDSTAPVHKYVEKGNITINHTFEHSGIYEVRVTSVNKVSQNQRTVLVTVEPEIKDVQVSHNSPQSTDTDVVFNFEFTGTNLLFPLKPQINLVFGDYFNDTISYESNPISHHHRYTEFGNYTVGVEIYNHISTQVLNLTIVVDEIIQNLTLHEPDFVKVGEETKIQARVSRGSRVSLRWSFSDEEPGNSTTYIHSRHNVSSVTHSYSKPGTYQTLVLAANAISNHSTSREVVVEHPVTGYKVFGETTSLLPSASPRISTLRLDMLLAKSAFEATNAQYSIDFDDGITVDSLSLRCSFSDSYVEGYRKCQALFVHNYTRSGEFTIKLTVKNNVSQEIYVFNHTCFEEISHLRKVVLFNHSHTYINEPGFGQNRSHYPMENSIIFIANKTTGNFLTYTWGFGDDSPVVSKRDDPISVHKYNKPGVYTITLNSSNLLDYHIISKTITIQRSVHISGISSAESITVRGTNHSFDIRLGARASNACYWIDFGDTSTTGGRYRWFGDEAECKRVWTSAFDFKNYEDVDITTGVFSLVAILNTLGQYDIVLNGTNLVSSHQASMRLGVTKGYCKFPVLDLEDVNQCSKPMCDENNLKKVYKSESFVVRSTVKVVCENTTSLKSWTVELWSERTAEWTNINKNLSITLASNSLTELFIPSRLLQYNLYKFTLNYSMTDFDGIWSQASVKIRIVKSPLVGTFIGGSFLKREWGKNHTLDATAGVVDPDLVDESKDGMSVLWFCKRTCESWPQYSENMSILETGDSSNCLTNNQSAGGCFIHDLNDGPGVLSSLRSEPWTISKDYILNLPTYLMLENETYNLRAVVKKDTRSIDFNITLLVTNGAPPQIKIECFTNCLNNKLNPVNRLALRSALDNEIFGVRYEYRWDILDVPSNGFDYTNPTRYKWDHSKWNQKASTGVESRDFALDEGVFTKDTYRKSFKIRAVSYRPTSPDLYGESYYEFVVNDPPKTENVSCTVTPPNGTALNTTFMVECTGFEDVDVPIKYSFIQKTQRNQVNGDVIDKNSKPRFTKTVKLPPGLESENNVVYIVVKATDSIGTSSEYVVEIPVFRQKISTAELSSSLANIESSGTAQEKGQLVIAMATMINDEGTSAQSSGIESNKGSSNPVDTGTGSSSDKETEPTAEETQKEKEKNKQLRLKMMDVIASVEVNDPETSNQLLGAAVSVTAKPDEVSEETQDKATEIASSASNQMKNMADDPSVSAEALEELADNAVKLLSNVLQASVETVMSSTDSSAQSSGQSPPGGSSSASSTSATESGSNDQVSGSSNGQKPAQDSQTVARAKARLKNTQNLLDQITDFTLKKKVIGESASTMGSGALVLSVRKQYTEKLNNVMVSANSKDDDSSFKLSDSIAMFGQSNDTQRYMSTVVKSEKVNPFPWAADSSAVSSNINSFSFKDSNDSYVKVSGLGAGQEIMMMLQEFNPTPNASLGRTSMKLDRALPHQVAVGKRVAVFLRVANLNNTLVSNVTKPVQYTNVSANTTATTPWFASSSTSQGTTVPASTTASSSASNSTLPPPKGSGTFFCVFMTTDGANPVDCSNHLKCTLPHLQASPTSHPDPNVCFLDTQSVNTSKEGKSILYKVRAVQVPLAELEAKDNNLTSFCSCTEDYVIEANYTTEVFSTSCLFYDEEQSEWNDGGCRVGRNTTYSSTQCFCSHLTSFASTFYVPMNRIVPPHEAFSQLDENPVCFVFSICIMALYLVIIVWARKADLSDMKKVGVTPLEDNRPEDKYGYEITVWTGFRAGAGTTAHVSIILTGDVDEDRPRLLQDTKRSILQKGSIDTFYMTTPYRLGKMSHLRVWHDNHGSSPSWFFSRMLVEDVQTGEKFYFICDRYLAVEEDDGAIDRVVPIAGREELTSFNHLFWSKTRRNLSDGHIWFSVFARPTRSKFTRVQRITCCLALVFGMMTANIMFYDTGDKVESPQSISLGPMSFSFHSLYVGVISSLITLPPSLIIITIFRMSKHPPDFKKSKKSANSSPDDKKQNLSEIKVTTLSQTWENQKFSLNQEVTTGETQMKYTQTLANEEYGQKSIITAGLSPGYSTQEQMKTPKKKRKWQLPWWFIIFGYILSYGTVAGAFIIIVGVGAGFGPKKSEEWLASMVVSLVETIFFTQPLKVLILGLFYALVIKKPDQDEDEDNDQVTDSSTDLLHPQAVSFSSKNLREAKRPPVYMPPDEHALQEARKLRFKEMEMYTIIKEIAFYMFFLYLLLMCAYGNQDPWSYTLKEKVTQEFLGGVYSNHSRYGGPMEISKVKTRITFWNWVQGTLIQSLYTDKYYNGAKVQGGRFTADHNMFLMGVARLRQLRVRPASCKVPKPINAYISSCRQGYNIIGEDDGSYLSGWTPSNTSDPQSDPEVGWNFTGAIDLEGYPYNADLAIYGGGGFVAELGRSKAEAEAVVNALIQNNWLDLHTRAVFVEFVLYNPSLNLYAISTIVIEFFEGGGALPFPRFHIMRLDRYVGSFMFVILAVEIITGLTILFFMVKEFRSVHKLKKAYFKDNWNVMEFLLMLLSIATIVMFFFRLVNAKLTLHNYRKNPTKFDNFQYTITWDEMYGIMLAMLVFGFTVKFLKLLRFNKNMSALFRTLSVAAHPLLGFSIIFGLVFLAFSQMAFLFFGKTLLGFKTFVATMETLGTMMLNRFDFNAFDSADPVLGPSFFLLYSILITFILVNMFMGILCDAFSTVKAELQGETNQYEIVDFMVTRFKRLIGFDTPKNNRISQEHNSYVGKGLSTEERCDEFQSKTDELLQKLSEYIAHEQSKTQFRSNINYATGTQQQPRSHKDLLLTNSKNK